MLSQLIGSDMVTLEMKYHLHCLVQYYRKAKHIESCDSSTTEHEKLIAAQAFSELVEYIEFQHGETQVLNMGNIYQLYMSRIR